MVTASGRVYDGPGARKQSNRPSPSCVQVGMACRRGGGGASRAHTVLLVLPKHQRLARHDAWQSGVIIGRGGYV